MIKHLRKLVFVFAMALLSFGCAGQSLSPMDMSKLTVYERMVNSVVVLPGCTGIVLKNDGKNSVVLTAAHCVRKFQVKSPSGAIDHLPVPMLTKEEKKICFGKVAAVAEQRDLAVIVVEKCPMMTTIAPMAASEPKLGSVVYTVGHPLGVRFVITKGIVSRVRVSDDEQEYAVFSAPVIYGNSGGPSFNSNGELIGVEVAIVSTSTFLNDTPIPIRVGVPHLALSVPLMEIKAFLKNNGFAALVK